MMTLDDDNYANDENGHLASSVKSLTESPLPDESEYFLPGGGQHRILQKLTVIMMTKIISSSLLLMMMTMMMITYMMSEGRTTAYPAKVDDANDYYHYQHRILQKFMMIMAMMITQGKFLSIGKFCWIERYTFVQMEKIWIELQKHVTQGKTIWKLFEIHHRPN